MMRIVNHELSRTKKGEAVRRITNLSAKASENGRA